MKRVGFLSGILYDDSFTGKAIGECCRIVTEEQWKDKTYLHTLRAKLKSECDTCPGGCPMSMKP